MHKCTWFKPNIVLMIFLSMLVDFFPVQIFWCLYFKPFFSLSLFIIICQLFFNCLTNFPRKILISALFERTLNPIAMQNSLIEFRWDWVVLFFRLQLRKNHFAVKKCLTGWKLITVHLFFHMNAPIAYLKKLHVKLFSNCRPRSITPKLYRFFNVIFFLFKY